MLKADSRPAMSPQARRILIPLIISAGALGVVLLVMLNPARWQPPTKTVPDRTPDAVAADAPPDDAQSTGGDGEADGARAAAEPDEQEPPPPDQPPGPRVDLTGLHAVAPDPGVGPTVSPESIGSKDWRVADFLIEFSAVGAGIKKIIFSDLWQTAVAKRAAEKIKKKIKQGEASLADLPADQRYVLQQPREFKLRNGSTVELTSFAARAIRIEGASSVNLFAPVWSQEVADDHMSATFITEIRNEHDEPVLRITRKYEIQPDGYDLTVEQRVENLTGQELSLQWLQYGPADLDEDPAGYMDRRRYRIGHQVDPDARPNDVRADEDFFRERGSLAKIGKRNRNLESGPPERVWPTEQSIERGYRLSWFAAENRYFAMTMHPVAPSLTGEYSLESMVATITPYYDGKPRDRLPGNKVMAFELESPNHTVEPGGVWSLDFAVFAGPLDRHMLAKEEPYRALHMDKLILYQLSSFCAIVTFQWLAHVLLWFLSLAHTVFFDWGFSIILLVVVVRFLLHPISKKSQVSMQRFGKVMQKIKPEMDRLQKKYKDEPKRLQEENMRLWREYGVSPVSMLGCLPMFLQTPIWIALYAMLYFAFDLRHEPAFWGIFQVFWDWPFLGDLSGPDRFIPLPFTGRLWMIDYSSFNILPLLMGVVFFVQQKYMTPSAAGASKDQQQMQKMMRIMFLLFPVMLYSAPSGLVLYILTSSSWGIIESRRIRKHVDSLDIDEEIKQRKIERSKKKKKPRDPKARAWADAMENARQRAKKKRQPPPPRFKKRK